MWPVDIDLLGCDDAGVYTCLMPRWSEWTVVDGQLWWVTPNPAFGCGADLGARGITRTWTGPLPDSALTRAFEYFRYNHKQLESKTRKGESLKINPLAIVRATAVKTAKHVIRTFEKGILSDDGDMLHVGIDSVLEDSDLDSSDSIFDEDLVE